MGQGTNPIVWRSALFAIPTTSRIRQTIHVQQLAIQLSWDS